MSRNGDDTVNVAKVCKTHHPLGEILPSRPFLPLPAFLDIFSFFFSFFFLVVDMSHGTKK